ncbi:MAG TPA: glycoside hydrolase family 9 protein [Bacillota bacterium]|nr:glycoside hydrolase family 9 protein [Bacillota bacterium]
MKKRSVFYLATLLLLVVILGAALFSVSGATDYNYTDAFAKSILFYEASWCGPDAGNNRIKWRGPCHVDDGKDVGLDLTGGFHDCGDHVKFGLPQTYAASTLAWAYYEFKDVFVAKGQDGYMLNILKHFTDYFMRCFPDDHTFYYQIGDGDTDHSYWGPPELQKITRPAFYVANAATPGSDVAGNAAATLALMSIIYQEKDADYAAKCLDTAKRLYTFGQTYRGNSSGQNYYRPNSYYDELMWGAIWLHIATQEQSYLDDVEKLMTERGIGGDQVQYYNHWTHCWDDVFGGVFLKMAQLNVKPKYQTVVEENLDYWMNQLKTTPGGMKYLHQWAPLKYTAAESFIALVWNKTNPNQKYVDFAKSQIDYILGSNPNNMSYVVGFGANYPKFPHHRAASGRLEGEPANESKKDPERHILYGALVGGPKDDDSYSDVVDDYVYTEVGLDYNAGLVGALAGMTRLFGANQKPEDTPGIEAEPAEYFVEAQVTYENNQQTIVKAYLHNITVSPPQYETGLTLRYFVDLSEYYAKGLSVNDLITGIDYTDNGAKIAAKLLPWDEAKHLYYAEISWPNSQLYGKCQVQFKIAGQTSIIWDATNDFSRNGLTATLAKTESLAIYKDGKLVYGKTPGNGTIPTPTGSSVVTPTPTPTITGTAVVTPTPTPTTTQSTGCAVSYVVQTDWGSGATVNVTIKNNTNTAINGWTLNWNFAGNQQVSNLWNGTVSQSGSGVTVKNASYNGTIAPNGTVNFGFNLNYSGTNAKPTAFTLNGTTCTTY